MSNAVPLMKIDQFLALVLAAVEEPDAASHGSNHLVYDLGLDSFGLLEVEMILREEAGIELSRLPIEDLNIETLYSYYLDHVTKVVQSS